MLGRARSGRSRAVAEASTLVTREGGTEMHATRVVTAVVALLAVSVTAAGAVSAARADDDGSRPGALVGTWDVNVQLPGAPPARVLATFNGDGTTVESAAAPPATRGASHGVWERIGRDLFSVTRIFFRFNPQTGAFLGTTKVNATARVASDRETFEPCRSRSFEIPPGPSYRRRPEWNGNCHARARGGDSGSPLRSAELSPYPDGDDLLCGRAGCGRPSRPRRQP